MSERAPQKAAQEPPILPLDVERCAGWAPLEAGVKRCARRFDCARFIDRTVDRSVDPARTTPFALSCCESGEAYIHAADCGPPRESGVSLGSHASAGSRGVA
jgi:hypothetical protein